MKPILTFALMMTAALAVVLAAPQASADAIRGFIQRRQLVVQRDDGSQTTVALKSATPSVQADLDQLKNGDYLVARGSLGTSDAQIDSIESLGLQALVGVWASDKLEVYEFQDFSRLNLYIPNEAHSDVVKAGEFQYSVTPDQGSRYAIFLSSNEAVTVGSIEFKKHQLVLNVIDPKTGLTSPDIVLSPLASPRH